jgi:tetratricopeptide (TPR) repeat protein
MPVAMLCAIGACLLATSAAAAVTPYHSPEGQFTADFPAAPVHVGLFPGNTAKGTHYYQYRWSVTNQEGYWGVAIFVYSPSRNPDYDANVAAAVAGAKGRLVSQKKIQQSGVEGREIVIESPNSVIARERLLWIGGRLNWIVFSSAKPGAAKTPAVDNFLNSFVSDSSLAPKVQNIAKQPQADNFDQWSECMGGHGTSVAVKQCTDLINSGQEQPENLPYAYVYRGKAELALNHNDEAFKDFTAALKSDPPLAHAYYGLGQVYRAREDWAHAAEELGKAAESQSEDADNDAFTADAEGTFRADSLTEKGYALYKAGDLNHPLEDFDAAAKLCPTCSGPYRDKALLLDAQQKSAEAAAAADRAIALNPRSGSAFLVRGILKAHEGKFEQAIGDYDEALRLSPDLDLAAKARASAYLRLHKQSAPPATDPAAVAALAATPLDDAALTRTFTAKSWRAHQGPWLAAMEFRGDGTFRQRLKDTSGGSNLEVIQDGVWGVSLGEVCIYTNVELCLSAHADGGEIVLAHAKETGATSPVEYSGAVSDFKNLSTDASTDPVAEFPIEEVLLPAPAGTAKGPKTLFYYMHGFDGHAREHSPLPEYFVDEIQKSRGWDVIDGNYPRSGVTQIRRSGGANFGAAVYLARRLKELKAQGYQRIYVGGQSWGGWTTLDLATIPGLPLDGVVLVVPACCGWRSTGAAHDDHGYPNNKIFFDQMIARVRYPTLGIFFLGDDYEPADRGRGAAAILTSHRVANLMIDHPPGFSGHGSAWFPPFDYEYGGCIANFLENPRTGYCSQRPITVPGTDFRSIMLETQLTGRQKKTATLADISGKQFAVYPTGVLSKVVSPEKTEVKGYGIGNSVLSSSFRGDLYCVRGRVKYNQPETTNEVCSRLVEWSDRELLAIDPQTGIVREWWVEHP